jgi:hypothetical protein
MKHKSIVGDSECDSHFGDIGIFDNCNADANTSNQTYFDGSNDCWINAKSHSELWCSSKSTKLESSKSQSEWDFHTSSDRLGLRNCENMRIGGAYPDGGCSQCVCLNFRDRSYHFQACKS